MGSRIPSHQLSSGLYVSGRPEQLKERLQSMTSRPVPYTGGDVKKSGELGKMFDIPVVDHPPKLSRASSSQQSSGSVRSGPQSGKLHKSSNSGSMPKKTSGQLTPIQPTGLITSAPSSSSVADRKSALTESSGKVVYGPAVTSLAEEKFGFKVSRVVTWTFLIVLAMALLVGVFLMVAVKKAVILVILAAVLGQIIVIIAWNFAWGKRGFLGFFHGYPNTDLRQAVDGQFVKITGIVTCGSVALESSYQRVPRCVYISTELYEYRGWGGKPAHPKHRFFTWGCRHKEKYIADFYISDFQSGLRAMVKAGYGAKVATFVKSAAVFDVREGDEERAPSFLQWLTDRSLSRDDRVMCLKEGCIKEGSTVSVMGVLRRYDNVVMILPPDTPISTNWQWLHCLFPTYIEGLFVTCDDDQNEIVIPV